MAEHDAERRRILQPANQDRGERDEPRERSKEIIRNVRSRLHSM